tara:strand:+ start:2521 stop:2997 length:477 start_codon:yes stop_codon:yes gene_type:complete
MRPAGWRRLSSVAHLRNTMGRTLEWRWFAVAGVILVAQSFIDITPEGPWNSRSFSRGMVGLTGLICIYIGWFRWAFDRKGVAPTTNLWKNPEETWRNVLLFGLGCLLLVKAMVWLDFSEWFPEPTGMILTLIGSLVILNAVYVGLITVGPLASSSEEE